MDKGVLDVSAEEKRLSGFAYLLGVIPAVIIWLIKKDDSLFVNFHALQAALYSGLANILLFILAAVQAAWMIIIMSSALIGTNLVADAIKPGTPRIYLAISLIMILLILISAMAFVIIAMTLHLVNIILAVHAFSGRDWRYPILANWVEGILQKDGAFSKG